MENLTLYDFFEAVENDKLSFTDRLVYIEKVTQGFNLERLQIFKHDLENHIERREQELYYEHEDVEKAIEELRHWGEEPPTYKVPNMEYYFLQSQNKPFEHLEPEIDEIDLPALLLKRTILNLREMKENLDRFIEKKEKEIPNGIDENESLKKDIPFKIALLKEIGFFDLPTIKSLPKTKQRKIIARLIGGTDRFIEGNISVLNEHSKEDPLRFTSVGKMEEVKRFISALNKK